MRKDHLIALAAAVVFSMTGSGTAIFAEEEAAVQEGSMEKGEGYTAVVTWCKNETEDRNIYGKFYYPADFDEKQKYPTIIMSHGLSVTHEIYEKSGWAMEAAKKGYVCYIFDFCGGSQNSLSDMEFMDMTVMTEKSDLEAVMDFVESKSFCDVDNLFMMGQSQGGLVTALEGAERKDEVAGMILLYPAFHIVNELHKAYESLEMVPEDGAEMGTTKVGSQYVKDIWDIDVMEMAKGYDKDVLIIHGMNDQSVPYINSVDAIANAYAESASELVLISGKESVHAFDVFYEEGTQIAYDAAFAYLENHIIAE